jgi:hypothetical protein
MRTSVTRSRFPSKRNCGWRKRGRSTRWQVTPQSQYRYRRRRRLREHNTTRDRQARTPPHRPLSSCQPCPPALRGTALGRGRDRDPRRRAAPRLAAYLRLSLACAGRAVSCLLHLYVPLLSLSSHFLLTRYTVRARLRHARSDAHNRAEWNSRPPRAPRQRAPRTLQAAAPSSCRRAWAIAQ